MIRAVFRFGFRVLRLGTKVALLAGAAFAVFKVFQSRQEPEAIAPAGPVPTAPPPRRDPPAVTPTPAPARAAAKAALGSENGDTPAPAATPEAGPEGWVEPDDGACPVSHPIKAKLSSGIYHLPGMVAYDRTAPDRCYVDEDTAKADGLRKSKR